MTLPAHSETVSYWEEKLKGMSSLILPTDYVRLPFQKGTIAELNFSIDTSLSSALRKLSLNQNVGLFSILLACFKVLLYRYSDQHDISVGTFISSNNYEDRKSGIDPSITPVVLRSEIKKDNNFEEFLNRVNVTILEAVENCDSFFQFMADTSSKEKRVTQDPILPVMFAMENKALMPNLDLAKTSSLLAKPDAIASAELVLTIKENNAGINASLLYNKGLFLEPTIKRMTGHFKELLASIVAEPATKLGLLSMLTAEEEDQLLYEFNDTAAYFPRDKTIVTLFEEQAAHKPAAIALVHAEKELTFGELNQMANRLANYLRSNGVKQETLVPICIERSLEMVIGILGILKAGGAYVPIDVDYPFDRIKFILEDTGASIVVGSALSGLKLKTIPDIKVVELTPELEILHDQAKENLQLNISHAHLAYVIYTSGSTGKPKGVMVEHGNIMNYLVNRNTSYIEPKQNQSGSFLHLAYTFDASLTAIFMPLIAGKKIVIGAKSGLLIFEDHNFLKHAPYDFIKITPAHLDLFRPTVEDVKGRWVTDRLVIGGEALHLSQFDYMIEKGVNVEIVNEYGPTEATVGCSTYSFKTLGNNEGLKNDISIGKPIANVQFYILDEYEKLAPIGIVGELCVGGAGVARGYLNRADLSAEKFVEYPFKKKPGSRIYKTGDLARWTHDGNVEYFGRKDNQVKISGYRIELGEIESVLNQYSFLRQSAVMVREDVPGKKILTAYLFPKSGEMLLEKDVQKFLSERLPDYMLPAAFVILNDIPINSNGKIDRAALPAPPQQKRALTNLFLEPGNDVEVKLKKIYEESLNIDSVGMMDSFFDLGGHSINALQICSRIRKTFNVQLPISVLFEAPTIRKLAIYVKEKKPTSAWSSLVPIQAAGTKPPLFCMHAGGGTVLFYQNLSIHLGMDQPVYGLQAKGLNGNEVPHTTVEQMATHYINEIRTVQHEGPYLLAGYCFGAILAFEMAQQLIRDMQKVRLLVSFNGVSPTYDDPFHQSNMYDENIFEDNSFTPKKRLNNSASFLKLDSKSKLSYLSFKLLPYKQRLRIKKFLYDFYIYLNKPLPEFLGKNYFLETNSDMVRAYKAKPYPGRMIIFRSPKIYPDPYLGWEGLVTGGIETCDIPGAHINRRFIMNEPFVQTTAEKLKYYLESC